MCRNCDVGGSYEVEKLEGWTVELVGLAELKVKLRVWLFKKSFIFTT